MSGTVFGIGVFRKGEKQAVTWFHRMRTVLAVLFLCLVTTACRRYNGPVLDFLAQVIPSGGPIGPKSRNLLKTDFSARLRLARNDILQAFQQSKGLTITVAM